jgi:ATP-dependent Clp protease protease subunit
MTLDRFLKVAAGGALIGTILAALISLAEASDTQKVNLSGGLPLRELSITKVDQSRVMLLSGKVDDELVDGLIMELRRLGKSAKKPAYLVIDSPGGSVAAGFDFIHMLQAVKDDLGLRLTCIITSKAYSMAAIIQSFCSTTYALPTASLMYHQAYYGVEGRVEDIRRRVAFTEAQLREYEIMLSAQLGISYESYTNIRKEELWMTAREAAEYGFIDGFVKSFYYEVEVKKPPPFFGIFGFIDYLQELTMWGFNVVH